MVQFHFSMYTFKYFSVHSAVHNHILQCRIIWFLREGFYECKDCDESPE